MTMIQHREEQEPQTLYAHSYYHDPQVRKIAHGIKNGNRQAILSAARAMTRLLPAAPRIILVPIPSRTGTATTTRLLAEEICHQHPKIEVMDVLRGRVRPSLYEEKKQGRRDVCSAWFGFRLTRSLPPDAEVFLVDNVEATGATMKAAMAVCGQVHGLVYAFDETRGRGLQEVTPSTHNTIMTPKNKQEQKATEMQAGLIARALDKAVGNDGIFLNASHHAAPTLYPRNRGVSGYNALILGLQADEGGYKTGVYTLFSEARKDAISIKQKEHGIPVMFTRWDTYANIKNPQDTVTKDEYKGMSPSDQALYRPKPTREMRVLFNLDQTTMHAVRPNDYDAIVDKRGSIEDRGENQVEDKQNRIKVNMFIDKVRHNLAAIQRDSTGIAHYDAAKDRIMVPAQNRFESYEDYVQEVIRQAVTATGHQQRLARQGVEVPNGRTPEQDKQSRERLIVELASAIKMQEMGMTARLAPESHSLVSEWSKSMKEDPCYLDGVAVDVNAALDVIAKAERGEKVEYASVRNEHQTAELAEAIGQKGKIAIENLQMIKDDHNRWTIFIKPEGQQSFNLYPDRDDLNRFFTTIKNGPEEAIDKLREELGQKYYAMAMGNPSLKIDLFGQDTPKADLDRIEKATIFRTKEGKIMVMPTIDGSKQSPREITSAQWQRMWLSDDMNLYKGVLAVQTFQDVLHPELAQKQEQDAGIVSHQVPEWACAYIINGDASGLTYEEQALVDEFLEKNFPKGYVPEMKEENREELNLSPAFGTRNPNALPQKGESPYQAVNTVEIIFHPAGEMRIMTPEEEKAFEEQDKKGKGEGKEQEAKVQEPKANEPTKAKDKKEEKNTESPLIKQFKELKKKHPDALLLFRCGDFYETYMHDAEEASKILGITLTRSSKTKDKDGKPISMAGFPYHSLDTYLPKLIRAGQRVAICDQIEAPKLASKRTVSELVTPGKAAEKEQKQQLEEEPVSRGVHR